MKNFTIAVAFFATMFTAAVILVGQCQYEKAQSEIQWEVRHNPDFGTDDDIQSILVRYGFDNDALEDVTLADYATAGIKRF